MYILLTLMYFYLECKILVKIPDSLLDSALALRAKEGDIVRGKYKLINVSDPMQIKPKHANSKFFSQRKLKARLSICIFIDIFLRAFFSEFLARRLADSLISDI